MSGESKPTRRSASSAASGLSDHFEVGFGIEQRSNAFADDLVIVHQQDSHVRFTGWTIPNKRCRQLR